MKTLRRLSLIIAALILLFWKLEAVTSLTLSAKDFLRTQYHAWKTHREIPGFQNLPHLPENPGEWYAKYHFIAHNGGIIHGRLKSDSLEAWEHSYSRGVRIIDADLSFTSDSRLVLRHSWRDDLEQDYFPGQPTLEAFKSEPIFQKYTLWTLKTW